MKYLLFLALLTVTTQLAYARCTGEEASYLINEIYGISNNNVTLKSIHPEAASSVAKICGSCYLRASKECDKRYVEAINQYLPLISSLDVFVSELSPVTKSSK